MSIHFHRLKRLRGQPSFAVKPAEPNLKAWFFRAVLGPAILIDGLVMTFSLGTFNTGLQLRTAKSLARARNSQ